MNSRAFLTIPARRSRGMLACLASAALGSAALAQQPDLAAYFGFEGVELIKIGRGAGPIGLADMNDDGLTDLIAVNNGSSRLEIHYQKKDASPSDEVEKPSTVNDIPEHWRFRKQQISLTHRITGFLAHDYDGDGLMDIIFGGIPQEVVFLRQTSPGVFETARSNRVKGLTASRTGMAIANVLGDENPELLALTAGGINIWPMRGDRLGTAVELRAGSDIVAFFVDDFTGDGTNDVAAVLPENASPVRLWTGAIERNRAALGAEVRFELPPLREFDPVHLNGDDNAAAIAIIERISKRIMVYQVKPEQVERSGERDASLRVYSFASGASRTRDHAVVDVDGDGLLDFLATDPDANAITVYPQVQGRGFGMPQSYPTLADVAFIVAGNVDDDPEAEVFVLSEKEGVVGRSDMNEESLGFPQPVPIAKGHTPVTFDLITMNEQPRLAIVTKDGRVYRLELVTMDGSSESIELGTLSRAPDTIVALDADQDGPTDLMLLTRDKPMQMLHLGEDGFTLRDSTTMGQFGLVEAASADNTAIFDIDGDGKDELLLATRNFVRALRYDDDPGEGVSAGWQVVEQINTRDRSSKLVSLALLDGAIVAADTENDRMVVMEKDDNGRWVENDAINVRGFDFSTIHAGEFSGDAQPNILALATDGFAVVRFSGERLTLEQVTTWQTTEEQRLQHELVAGDVNNDGFADLVSLDAGEQMCEILTFTESNALLYAMGFKVFESKLFTGGESREYEPSEACIGDLTGDGANDIVLLAHDRVLLYPQMTKESAEQMVRE